MMCRSVMLILPSGNSVSDTPVRAAHVDRLVPIRGTGYIFVREIVAPGQNSGHYMSR